MVGMSRLLRTCSHPDPTRIYSDSSKWTQYTLPVCSLGYGYFAEKFAFRASCPHQFNGISQDQRRSQEPCDYLCDQGLIPDDISKPLTLVDSIVLIADLYNMCTIVMVEKAWQQLNNSVSLAIVTFVVHNNQEIVYYQTLSVQGWGRLQNDGQDIWLVTMGMWVVV